MRLDHTAHATGCTFYACIRTHAHTCNRLYIQCTHLSQIHPTNPASKSLNHSSDARRTTFHLTLVAGSNSKVAQDKSLDSSQLFSQNSFANSVLPVFIPWGCGVDSIQYNFVKFYFLPQAWGVEFLKTDSGYPQEFF